MDFFFCQLILDWQKWSHIWVKWWAKLSKYPFFCPPPHFYSILTAFLSINYIRWQNRKIHCFYDNEFSRYKHSVGSIYTGHIRYDRSSWWNHLIHCFWFIVQSGCVEILVCHTLWSLANFLWEGYKSCFCIYLHWAPVCKSIRWLKMNTWHSKPISWQFI